MRSHGSVVACLLLHQDRVLDPTRRWHFFAPKTFWSYLQAAFAAQGWLEPGLIVAAILLLLILFFRSTSSRESLDQRPLHRVFRAPDLSRFRGIAPRRHQDLEA